MRVKIMWAVHNIIGHPIMEILRILGLKRLGDWVHDSTLPAQKSDFKAVCTEGAQYESHGVNYSWFGRIIVEAAESGAFVGMRFSCLSSHSWAGGSGEVEVLLDPSLNLDEETYDITVNRGRPVCFRAESLALNDALHILGSVLQMEDLDPSDLPQLGLEQER